MDREADSYSSFLPLTEAAERLGISRLKLREAIAKGVVAAQRDNQGEWRADLTGVHDISRQTNAIEADPDVLMGLLFDEVEALSTELQVAEAARDRFAALADRALIAAEATTAQLAQLRSTAERAFGVLDRATLAAEQAQAEVEAKNVELAGQAGQIERLFTLSEQAVATAALTRKPGWIARLLGLSGPTKR